MHTDFCSRPAMKIKYIFTERRDKTEKGFYFFVIFTSLLFFIIEKLKQTKNLKRNPKQRAPGISLNFFQNKWSETLVIQTKLRRVEPMLWVNTSSDEVFSPQKHLQMLLAAGIGGKFFRFLLLRETIEFDSLNLHQRCLPRTD